MTQVLRGRMSPQTFQFLENIGAFIDEGVKFDKYLRKMNTNRTAASQGLMVRSAHRIHPKARHEYVSFGLNLTALLALWLLSFVIPTKCAGYFEV